MSKEFLHARTCYGHLAGEIAVKAQRNRRTRIVTFTPSGTDAFRRTFGL